jgi:transposase
VVQTGPANENDERRLEGLLRAMPEAPTKRGKPRRVSAVLADAAYGVARAVAMVLATGYRALLKPRGGAGRARGSGLGRRRYVVERALSWLGNFRRLKVCYERAPQSWQSLHELAACVVCANRLDAVRSRARRPT